MDAELRRAALIACATLGCDLQAEPQPRQADVPDVAYCDPVRAWSGDAEEIHFVEAIVDARLQSQDCGALGRAEAVELFPRLLEDGALTCAARVHALDMATRGFFGHEDPDGVTPWRRIEQAGYPTVLATELVAMGEIDPERVVQDLWLPNAPHCGALMAPEWIDVGVARHALPEPPPDDDTPANTWWVVVLAMPDPAG